MAGVTVTRGTITRTSAGFSYSATLPSNTTYTQYRMSSGLAWANSATASSISLSSLSGSRSCSYVRTGTGTTTDTITVQIYYEKRTYEFSGYWGAWKSGDFFEVPAGDDVWDYMPEDTSTEQYDCEYVSSYTDADGKKWDTYEFFYREYIDTSGWGSWTYQGYYKNTATFYPAPAYFSFTGCTQGAKWLLKKGINSLITNIEDFYDAAQQWRSWSSQRAITTTCPSFFNSNNELCATGLNSVYRYVGDTASYEPGEKVAASMFNGLATIINTTQY